MWLFEDRRFAILFLIGIGTLFFSLSGCGGGVEGNGSPEIARSEEGTKEQKPLSASQGKGKINCFAYHRVGEKTLPSTNISLDLFESHLKYLKEEDFQVLTFGQAWKQLNEQEGVSEKTVVLTFDDGYKSVKTNAVPLLQKYGFKATIFVCTEYVGGGNYMNWPDLKELREKGFEIGNHSDVHPYFLNQPQGSLVEFFRKDLSRSEERFRQHFGKVPDLYAYPYGEYDPSLKTVLEEKGYKAAMAQRSGVIHSGSDRYAMPRYPMNSLFGKTGKFKEKANMYPLPVKKTVPESPVIESSTPPLLKLTLGENSILKEKMNCFVDGKDIGELKVTGTDPLVVEVKSTQPIKDRRTLYTITAPSKEGKWYWYSFLWVRPEIKGDQ